ncbi:MAG TPA: TIGR02680 family protein, partial [Candidatus Merdenecus merdavium]|nr:TIGR02680 family protein [Candidatus Merdenecus merdavium]
KLSLRWKSKRAEHENQLDTSELVTLLKKDADLMTPTEYRKMSEHFRSKIQEARQELDDTNTQKSFHMLMKEILDYRMWFEFQLESQKSGERKKELTDRVFFTFSGGEKAMAMYVPLFSAVVAKYDGARNDAPRLISLDEAFAGVDELNIKDMFRLMVELEFDFMINSQILWGDYETVPSLAIYELIRPENVKYVTVISYIWNGIQRMLKDGRNKRTQS